MKLFLFTGQKMPAILIAAPDETAAISRLSQGFKKDAFAKLVYEVTQPNTEQLAQFISSGKFTGEAALTADASF